MMVERLGWMDEVAMVKQSKGLPVEDAVREAEVLDAMVALGSEMGLPGTVARGFFAAQIEAAKVCQEEWLGAHPGALRGEVPDLGKTVRPALDAIGKRMLGALVEVRGAGNGAAVLRECRRRLVRAGYSEEVIEAGLNFERLERGHAEGDGTWFW